MRFIARLTSLFTAGVMKLIRREGERLKIPLPSDEVTEIKIGGGIPSAKNQKYGFGRPLTAIREDFRLPVRQLASSESFGDPLSRYGKG